MRVTLWLFIFGVPVTAQAQKDEASCKTSLDAALKTAATPHHAYTTTAMPGGKNQVAEAIAANGKNYVLVGGSWRASPMSVADLVKQEKENVDSAKVYTCKAIRDEAVSGQATTVYQVRTETEGLKSDGQVWVAKGTGLVMRVEQDMDTGGDASSKMHMSTKYDYSNVKAPPGV